MVRVRLGPRGGGRTPRSRPGPRTGTGRAADPHPAGLLDHNNSPARAAEALHLHRNAVGARVRRVIELTGADLADPEVRLALQLACRAVAAGADGRPAPGSPAQGRTAGRSPAP
ncbi:helix-turn-helix domain-containing protein [Streptomyces mexicanus]